MRIACAEQAALDYLSTIAFGNDEIHPPLRAAASRCRRPGRPEARRALRRGIMPSAAGPLVSLHLLVGGPSVRRPESQNPFRALKDLAVNLGALTKGNLSMGMSADYEEALRQGATHVRIGTALFGSRD